MQALQEKRRQGGEYSGTSIYGTEPDFDNPSQEMLDDAKKRGIDLKDPKVVEMLKGLQQEKKERGSDFGKDSGYRASTYDKQTRSKLKEMMAGMESRELKQCLAEMDIEFDENRDDDYYKDLFVGALMKGKKIPDGFAPTPRVSVGLCPGVNLSLLIMISLSLFVSMFSLSVSSRWVD